jgi:hypothetical protein
MGRRRDGNHFPQKHNSIQDSMGNEDNGYLVPDLNETMINVTKGPGDTHIKMHKEEMWEEISDKTQRKY